MDTLNWSTQNGSTRREREDSPDASSEVNALAEVGMGSEVSRSSEIDDDLDVFNESEVRGRGRKLDARLTNALLAVPLLPETGEGDLDRLTNEVKCWRFDQIS